MSQNIELDLDALVVAAEACGESWYEKRDIGNVLDLVSDEDNRFVLDASPLVVLELVRRLRMAEAAVSAKLSEGFNPSGITVLHMDCVGVDIEHLKRLFDEHRTLGQAVIVLPVEAWLENMDEDAMRAAGWVRAERGDA